MTEGPTQALLRRLPLSYEGYYARQGRTLSSRLANLQQSAYETALERSGLRVSYIAADEVFPDCVFIEDTAVVWGRHVLVTRMTEHREGEQEAVVAALSGSHTISRLERGAALEGGDVLHIGETTYVGLSVRTNEWGAESLRAFFSPFGRRIVSVPVTSCLHLKTAATFIGDGTLLVIPGSIDIGLFDVDRILYTEDGESGAANCLRVRDRLMIPDRYPGTRRRLLDFAETHGLDVECLNISEFEKGEGSLTCLSLTW